MKQVSLIYIVFSSLCLPAVAIFRNCLGIYINCLETDMSHQILTGVLFHYWEGSQPIQKQLL